MVWKEEYLDLILVPSGLLIMFGYHLFLLYRCLKLPHTTAIGCENHYRNAWVERMLQVEIKERSSCLTVISSTISAATFFASTSLALSSLIGALFGSTSNNVFESSFIYGNTSPSIMSVKYVSLLFFFMVAFASFLQCIRSLVLANFLISMPNSTMPVDYAQKALIRGSAFWSVGIRAIYFATTLLLLEMLSEEFGGRVGLANAYYKAPTASLGNISNGIMLNCYHGALHDDFMFLGTEAISVGRVGDDFWYADPLGDPNGTFWPQGCHTVHYAYNSLWMGNFIHPDWDMFQSTHPCAEFHTASWAICGGPIYVCDSGKPNFQVA